MHSRYHRIQERRTTRKAFLLFLSSIGIILLLIFLGIPTLARFAAFIGELKQSSSIPLQEDKTPPAPPYINTLPAHTKESKITLVGNAEAGSTLKIFKNGEALKETLIDEASSFETEIELDGGENRIWATATDTAGNESESSAVKEIVYDKEAPSLEISKPADGEAVSEKTITVEGTTESNARVTVNDRLAVIDSNGKFSQRITLTEGENTLIIVAVDEAENKTEKQLKVIYSP